MIEYNKNSTSYSSILRDLEANWEIILADYASIRNEKIPYVEEDLYVGEWGVIPFMFFGQKYDNVCDKCTNTWDLLKDIPGLLTASFSVLSPGTEIVPHTGFTDKVTRIHLGLKIPTDCALVVDNTKIEWKEGRCFFFDDTKQHYAYNRGSSERAILILDIDKSQYE